MSSKEEIAVVAASAELSCWAANCRPDCHGSSCDTVQLLDEQDFSPEEWQTFLAYVDTNLYSGYFSKKMEMPLVLV